MDNFDKLLLVILVISLALCIKPVLYGLGLAFSRGFHRGKREFVSEILKDAHLDQVKEKDKIDA